MNIALKNVKHNEALSEETHCFSATVYLNGKRAFGIKNAGHGGEDEVYSVDQKTEREVMNTIAAIDADLGKEKCQPPYESMKNCLGFVVGDLVNVWLRDKEIKKVLRNITYTSGGKVFVVKGKPTNENMTRVKQQKWWKDKYIILNSLPIADVRQYFN